MQTALHHNRPAASLINQPAENSILKTLAYFDIFHYPLLQEELEQFLDQELPEGCLSESLQQMVISGNIFEHHGYYSLQDNPLLVHRRREGNLRAEKLLPRALKIGRFLYRFPFVRSVGISGSLSKNFADERDDIDFFIIAKANRLWIARTFMHLFKKLTFLTGHQHFFCMNYYIDEQALLLEDQNIFTATEIKTVLPVSGGSVMNDFFAVNNWSEDFLPACAFRQQAGPAPAVSRVKRFAEWLLDNKTGNRLDDFLLRITSRRWRKKEERNKRNEKGMVMKLITGKHFARSKPGAFQEKVLALYEEKLSGLKL